jgi:hypothetical protein
MHPLSATIEEPSTQKRRVNDLMRDGLRLYDPDGPIPFFCECSRDDCYRAVWRTGREYDDARSDESWRPHADHARDDQVVPSAAP